MSGEQGLDHEIGAAAYQGMEMSDIKRMMDARDAREAAKRAEAEQGATLIGKFPVRPEVELQAQNMTANLPEERSPGFVR